MPKIRQILASPQILQTPDGRRAIVASATPAIRAARTPSAQGTRFLARGYQQTDASAADGGVANANGFRFRRGAMRALARTFRGQPFITGHDWGDVRARGGTIMDAYAEELEAADQPTTAINYEIDAVADWAREGLENGTIDRFSLGVDGTGEIMCTVHNAPMWSLSECWCFPGELVSVTRKNDQGEDVVVELVAEWEWEGGIGLELSGVNVPAVGNTEVIEIYEDGDESPSAARASELLASVCGRPRPRRPRAPIVQAGLELDPERFLGRPLTDEERREFTAANTRITAAAGGGARAQIFTPAPTTPSMGGMNHEELCRMYGLPVTATPDELKAKMGQVIAAAAQVPVLSEQLRAAAPDRAEHERQLAAERDRAAQLEQQVLTAHVDAGITRLRTARVVRDPVIASLRATATASGRAAFDSSLRLVEDSAPAAAPPVGGPRAPLQSDLAPAPDNIRASAAADGGNAADLDGPDAYEANKENPHLNRFMRACGLKPDDVRKHGPRAQVVVPELQNLIDNSPH